MSYRIDPYDKSIVIEGFENGIADSPFQGISDMRNVNIISVPGEASVNFSTSKITAPTVTNATIASADPATELVTLAGAQTLANLGLETYMAISFSATTIPGVSINTTYWIIAGPASNNFYLYSDYQQASLVNITGTGTGTFSTIDVGQIRHFTYASRGSNYWGVDTNGRVWSNSFTTTSGYWTYTGNTPGTGGNGNGLVYYQASDGTDFIFSFRNSRIDYTPAGNSLIAWVYGWNPADGTTGNATNYLKTLVGVNNSHEAIVAPDNKVYYCDANWIGRFYQASPTVAFVPTTPSTYVFDQTAVLPFTDIANCLAPLGNNLLVGGSKNVVYPWDTFSQLPNYPILLPENNIVKMVTVNTNTFIFVGNRGRIYYTNGSQAQLYKKIPDHISGTVEPYFTWGGATSSKNQLYFSVLVNTNSGSSLSQYGGLWAIDLDTKAIRLTNKLSYATYAGYASAIIPNFGTSPAGTGLYIGWNSGASTYGIDTTSSTPYTGSQAVIVSDLIPIGTFTKPRDFEQVEYRLTKPMVSGESINIYARLIFNTTDTGFGSAILTDSTVGNFSSSAPVNFKNAQWLQLQAVLNSTASSPSYTRLKEIRITGLKE